MSIIHLNQIKAFLEKNIFSFIDQSDISEKLNEDQKRQMCLTRSLAAYSIQCYVEEEVKKIAKFVIDGSRDNGIDCFFYDDSSNLLLISQAKWPIKGSKTIERGDVQKFIKGVKDLINSRYDRFNEKLQRYKDVLDTALQHPNTRIKLIITYPGTNDIADEPRNDLQDFINEMNDTSDVLSFEVVNQSFLHRAIGQGVDASPINDDIILSNWGIIEEPYSAFYGMMSGKQIADLYLKYEKKLFTPNIRSFLADSEINKQIENTVRNEPESFFYYNNGITFTTENTKKRISSGTNRSSGIFFCQNISVINGAQTIGSIAKASKESLEEIEKINVLVKIIILKESPQDFQAKVTRAANTQNVVGARDFITQDLEQERLKTELQIEGIYYSYKRGDYFQNKDMSFEFDEAISALANSQKDIKLVTKAKREIGILWEDINKPPYKALFNPTLTSIRLWNIVRIQRIIDQKLNYVAKLSEGKKAQLVVHGNKYLSFLVFRELKKIINLNNKFIDINNHREEIENSVTKNIDILNNVVEKLYPDDYLGNLFKTVTKSKIMYDEIFLGGEPKPKVSARSLFPDE